MAPKTAKAPGSHPDAFQAVNYRATKLYASRSGNTTPPPDLKHVRDALRRLLEDIAQIRDRAARGEVAR